MSILLLLTVTIISLASLPALDTILARTINNSPNNPFSHDELGLEEFYDQNQPFLKEESSSFLKEINNRLDSGEDPETLVDLFVYWNQRQPDFPEWVDVVHSFDLIPVMQVSCKLGEVSEAAELRYVSQVMEMGTGHRRSPSAVDSLQDPYIGEYPLFLNETRSMIEASGDSTTGSGVVVAILSTGINETHPMLDDQDDDYDTADPKILDSFDAYDYAHADITDDTIDYIGWGTALASIVAGTDCCGGQFSNSITFQYPYPYDSDVPYDTQNITDLIDVGTQMGIAPEVSLLDVKITITLGTSFTETSLIVGIEWAVAHGADVILVDADNLDPSDITVISAIAAATELGALVVVPAGDYDPDVDYEDGTIAPYYTIGSPASAPSALTVGATTETDALWLESERGPVPGYEISKPDVVAPGVHMLAANHEFADNEAQIDYGWEGDPGSETDTQYYRTYSGTAVAAAVAAGASARLIESYPGASPTAIKIALRKGALDLGFNEMAQGKGRIRLLSSDTILETAEVQSDNYLGAYQTYSDPTSPVTYEDFSGKRILFDGSYSTSTAPTDPPSYRDWNGLTNGNLTTLGVAAGWQHPYNDVLSGSHWYNISYPGTHSVWFTITNITLGSGDTFSLYRSSTPNHPNPTIVMTQSTNWTGSAGLVNGDDYYYFEFDSDGDGTASSGVFGIYGSVQLRFYAEGQKPSLGTFEFDLLADKLNDDLGAIVEYWYPASANAPPTSTILEYYDIYVIGQPLAAQNYGAFSLPSASSYYEWLSGNLTTYVNNGGKVLFIGDAEASYYDAATSGFDVFWHQGGVGGPTTNFVSHSVLTTPFTITELLIDAPYAYFSGSAPTIVYDGNVPTVVYDELGSGQAVFVADEDVFNDEVWKDPYDPKLAHRYNNSHFAMNIFYWLAEVSYRSGPRNPLERSWLVSYSCPKLMTNGDTWELDLTFENIGNVTTKPLVGFGMGWNPSLEVLGAGADNMPADGRLDLPGHDNANDTWDFDPDGDFAAQVTDTTIEFYYNISDSYPVDQILIPHIDFDAWGVDRQTDECTLYLNGEYIGPLYETNISVGGSAQLYYNIHPNQLEQYNNKIAISVPDTINLTVSNFQILGLYLSSNLGQTQQVEASTIDSYEQTSITMSFTPDINNTETFEPVVVWRPSNLTHAWVSPGFAVGTLYLNIQADYGLDIPGYYDDAFTSFYGINKSERRGDLPLLYDITPNTLTSTSSTKIAQFPGDLRVDGLTLMSSTPIESPDLRLSGGIAAVVGLGNLAESSVGLGSYRGNDPIAPDYFYYNNTWASTTTLLLDSYNHTLTGLVLQTYVPSTASATVYSGTLGIYTDTSLIYSISLRLTVEEPEASFLLYDLVATDIINEERNYDKLWDQVFEVWKIASEAGYDIDSIYQETYLYEIENHVSISTTNFLDYHVYVPCGEELAYAGILGIGLDTSSTDATITDFLELGGSLVQFTADFHLGPEINSAVTYADSGNEMLTLIDGTESDHPLLSDVDHLLYTGGGYLIVDQQDYLDQLTYDVISGLNWETGNTRQEIALIYHDPIYPYQFCYDSGKYEPNVLQQTYNGTKIIVGTDIIAQSWFLEQIDVWGYFSLQYAAQNKFIPQTFDIDLDNRQFIENILHAAANKAPTINSIEVTPEHVAPGEKVTVRVNVTDDQSSELTVLCPENIESNALYQQLSYDSNTSEYVGSFRVIDITQIHNWNILVFDDFYRVSWALDYCKSHLIPRLNIKPVAWMTYIENAPEYEVYEFYILEDVDKGDFLSLPVYFEDHEDGVAVDCNVSLIYYKNIEESEIVVSMVFSGTGFGMFLVDTTDFKDGSYIIAATTTDTDGGTGTYLLAGFNIGKGTLLKEPEDGGFDIVPVIGGLGVLGLVGAAAGGGAYYFYYYKRKTPGD